MSGELFIMLCRFRQLRQPHERPGGDPGHERVPDRHEATQGPVEEAQRRQQALLRTWTKLRLKEGRHD